MAPVTGGKVTLAGVCRTMLEAADGPLTLAELTQACIAAGLEISEAQCYAGVQSMASTGKCDRGPNPRTWVKLGAGRGAGQGRAASSDEDAAPRTRTRRGPASAHGTYSTEQILRELEERLGPPIKKPDNQYFVGFVLLGEWNTEFILARAQVVLHEPAKVWCIDKCGPNVLVGFLLPEQVNR